MPPQSASRRPATPPIDLVDLARALDGTITPAPDLTGVPDAVDLSGIPDGPQVPPGGRARRVSGRVEWNFDGIPDAPAAPPPQATRPPADTPTWNFDGIPKADRPLNQRTDSTRRTLLVNNDLPHQLGREAYAAIPMVTGAAGAMIGGTLAAPTAAVSGPVGPATGALVGAGAGGIVGRGIQWVIDRILNRDPLLQNPASIPEEATRQMTYEAGGQILAAPLRLLRGGGQALTPEAATAADRAATAKQYSLKLSTPEITGSASGARVQAFGARGLAGQTIQQRARQQTQAAVDRAVKGILDTVSSATTPLHAGATAQEAIQSAAARSGRRLEGTIATQLSPATGATTTGQTVAEGVQAARRGFTEVQRQYGEIVKQGPDVDIRPLKDEALRILHDEVMPALFTVPDLGPNAPTFNRLRQLYAAGQIVEFGTESQKLLNSEALKSSTSPVIRALRRVLTARDVQPFDSAAALRTALREAGKAPDELVGDAGKGVATHLATTLRGIMADAHPAWDAASAAYGSDVRVFQSRFLRNLIGKDPEAVLTAVSGKDGRVRATRINQLRRTLLDTAAKSLNPDDATTAQRAWDTLRAEWFRREVFQHDLFGLTERLQQTDRNVLSAWFPDVPGQMVLRRATQAGRQFEGELLRQIADADPAKVLDLIGATPTRVTSTFDALHAVPNGDVAQRRLQRAWLESTITSGDPTKLADRLGNTDPDLLRAWMPRDTDRAALANLRRLGAALATQKPLPNRGLYEGVEAATVVGSLLRGNMTHALQIAVGFEGIPALLSWAIYNPKIQQYMLTAAQSELPVTTRTAALLRAANAWRDAQQTERRIKTASEPPEPNALAATP